ncbi:zinc finger BED domain-containing protein 1-like [Rhizophagus irregularis DAOM 181602=DAOM 197198]|uniref:Uncharacterized protein n=2 Tax=Rhizophagus irregularis TaxID=588596 RepID=A0A015N024_RHIIW|nr:hypothetical protein RirG_069640 [Rhizophagus irregularis DAOM 197198w]GET66084.1 zinc finger BED domain-containing protein 1-like [Rhizophagus irregularis DAOM 181602=DAOM 197198]
MSNENINNKKRVWSQIDIENPSQFSNHEESLDIQRKTENAFDKLNKEKSGDSGPSNVQNKGKGGSKLRSWYIIGCNQKYDNGEYCTVEIEISGPTGNIISHLNRKHKIYESTKPAITTPPLKQIKIDHFTISSDSSIQMTSQRQKYLENLLYEWLVLDCQPFYLLKSPAFRQFINALNENFELPSCKEFRKKIFEAFDFTRNQLIQYIQENAISVSLT